MDAEKIQNRAGNGKNRIKAGRSYPAVSSDQRNPMVAFYTLQLQGRQSANKKSGGTRFSQTSASSDRNTVAQATQATGSRPLPRHAMTRAAAKPIHAETGWDVAVRMDGKVMTASVT